MRKLSTTFQRLSCTPTNGPEHLMDQTSYPPRQNLTPSTAKRLAQAHRQTGATYTQVAVVIGIDGSYWRRLTLGERSPSRSVALRIIVALDLDEVTAQRLLGESVDKSR